MNDTQPDAARQLNEPTVAPCTILPWQRVKSPTEDVDAPRRVQAIMCSPSYKMADNDTDFLNHPELRAVRLPIEYLKPELAFETRGIEHTIVVFGSTRLREPLAAQLAVQAIQNEVAMHGATPDTSQRLSVAQRLLDNSRYYSVAREFGRLVGSAGASSAHGEPCRVMLMTGGGPGIMEAANRGAFDIGAQSIGLNINLPYEQYPNPYVTPELCFRFHYFALRKLHFLLRAKALVAFPGGYGTLDELFETLTLVQSRKIKPVPIVLVGKEYWQRAINFQFMVDEGVIEPSDLTLFEYAETADEIWQFILAWHHRNGAPLI